MLWGMRDSGCGRAALWACVWFFVRGGFILRLWGLHYGVRTWLWLWDMCGSVQCLLHGKRGGTCPFTVVLVSHWSASTPTQKASPATSAILDTEHELEHCAHADGQNFLLILVAERFGRAVHGNERAVHSNEVGCSSHCGVHQGDRPVGHAALSHPLCTSHASAFTVSATRQCQLVHRESTACAAEQAATATTHQHVLPHITTRARWQSPFI